MSAFVRTRCASLSLEGECCSETPFESTIINPVYFMTRFDGGSWIIGIFLISTPSWTR
ncbi:hypothetical protein ANAPRD1_00526 [Anaplasma phagocytophilum]|nr:hypothetical protein ANAPRD1_00526 [Anaplasma phagocytophilum]SCV64428.1 hypothetical protein ANAPH1_00595 [Anaplasma phagocytophilum]